jgi:hypothetical protein
MINGKRKMNAMLLALCMLITAFVAVVSLPVGANEISNNGDFEIFWIDNWMEDDPAVIPDDEDIIFNYDFGSIGTDSLYYLGDEGAEIELVMYNDGTNDFYDLYMTLASNDPIITAVPDSRFPITGDIGDDPSPGPGEVITPGERVDDDPVGGPPGLNGDIPSFTIDIDTSGAVNTVYADALELTISYFEEVGGGTARTDTFLFDIYISSVFDQDNNDAARDTHDDLPDIDETDADDEFEAGVMMQEGEFFEDNWGPFSISDVEGTISSLPAGISLAGGFATAVNPGPISGNGGNLFLYWRFDVASNVAPGPYSMDLAFQYVRDDTGETINEGARPTELTVDFTPRLTARLASSVTISQNDLSATLSVIFSNDGNVDLNDVEVRFVPDGDWLDVRFHHYENDDDVYETEVAIGDLLVGADSAAQTVVVATDMMLPNGSHRVPFAWSSWIFEDGSTGDASRWVMMGGEMYNHDGSSQTPEVERFYEDTNENRRYNGGEPVLEPEWDGTFVDFEVDDDNGLTWEAFMMGEVEAGRDDMTTNADVTYTLIEIVLFNRELVDYKDLVVEIETGADSPFFDPADHAATSLMMHPMSDTTIDAQSTADIFFQVDVNAAWWQDSAFTPETYMVDLTVDATNDHDEVRTEDVTIPAQVNINGFGPELFASLVSYTKITPGQTFTLTVTITNYGDDTAREIDAYLRADFVKGWSIVDQFTTSIGGYGGAGDNPSIGDASWGWQDDWSSYTQFNRSHDIRPAELGVESVPQIVELNDWISRRETPPQGTILWMHNDRLEAGETWSVEFEMISDVNMVDGMVYYEVLDIYYVDSNGETYGPEGSPVGNVEDHYAPPQEVLVRTGKGEAYDTSATDFGWMLYMIIFVIIAFIIFLIGFAMGGKGGRGGSSSSDEAPFEDYEQEYIPPPEEDMGPPPEPEEDLGPPPMPEEEKPPE